MRVFVFSAALMLSACAAKDQGLDAMSDTQGAAETIVSEVPGAAETKAQIRPHLRPESGEQDIGDTEAAAQEAPEPSGKTIGTTIASLGNAAEPGLWLKTPLVRKEAPGKVSYAGKTVTARLVPIDGPKTAGSRASLQLMQALGAPLTSLPEVTVTR